MRIESFRSLRAFRALGSIEGAVVGLGMDRPRLVMLLTVVGDSGSRGGHGQS